MENVAVSQTLLNFHQLINCLTSQNASRLSIHVRLIPLWGERIQYLDMGFLVEIWLPIQYLQTVTRETTVHMVAHPLWLDALVDILVGVLSEIIDIQSCSS